MKNYYDEITQEIGENIASENYAEARKLLEEELAAPYVPEPYLSEFVKMHQALPGDKYQGTRYFQDIDMIIDALFADELLQIKALKSLERSNLKLWYDDIEQILRDVNLEDWLKKQIIVLLLEQGFTQTIRVYLEDKDVDIDLKHLVHPFKTEAYISAVSQLETDFAMKNPSFLELCIMELNYKVSMAFPFQHEDINVDDIINQVNIYLNAN